MPTEKDLEKMLFKELQATNGVLKGLLEANRAMESLNRILETQDVEEVRLEDVQRCEKEIYQAYKQVAKAYDDYFSPGKTAK